MSGVCKAALNEPAIYCDQSDGYHDCQSDQSDGYRGVEEGRGQYRGGVVDSLICQQ